MGVWVGAYLTWQTPVYYGPAVASLLTFLACAAGNIVNDLRDINIDRVAHPGRVLPQGDMDLPTARRLAVVFAAISILASVAVNWYVVTMALVANGLLVAYNFRLKRILLIGNLVIALLAGLTFITGGLAADPALTLTLPGPLVPAVFAFLFHLVREIVKDIQDIEGDRALGLITFPQVVGVQKALIVCLGLFFALVLLTYLPVYYLWYGRWYEILTVYVTDLPLLVFLILLWGNPNRTMLRAGALALKIGMVVGLFALIGG